MLRSIRSLTVQRTAPRLRRGLTDNRKRKKFSVDRTGLINFEEVDADVEPAKQAVKEPLSPLGKDLKSYIKLKGPITLHDYMAQSLNHLLHGYYQGKGEVIGERGDFITAPEVSQLFGEMIGVWCMLMWEEMGSPSKLNLIELGPGKGTLMKDILRTTSKFLKFTEAVSVHFVELSSVLRMKQCEALGCTVSQIADDFNNKGKEDDTELVQQPSIKDGVSHTAKNGTTVQWHSFLHQVPMDVPNLIIGQEFLDAFPVHQFVYTEKGWREKLVDINTGVNAGGPKPPLTNPRLAKAKEEALAKQAARHPAAWSAEAVMKEDAATQATQQAADATYHFRFVLSPSQTPAVKSLLNTTGVAPRVVGPEPGTSADASAAADTPAPDIAGSTTTTVSAGTAGAAPKVGDGIEISPMALSTCEDVATRVVKCGGAALFIDYGEDCTQEDTLRAFHKHKQVHVLSQPGQADVTADVDFSLCRKVAVNKGAVVPPLSTQSAFLLRMGIVPRLEKLFDADETTDEQANALMESFKYLVDPAKMGQKFKVLSIVSPALRRVAGFSDE